VRAREDSGGSPPSPRLGRGYRTLLAATTVSNLGDGVASIAYPWLASAVTRNPVIVASVAIAQRLPWLVFTLPAGVITDRVDRRRLMVAMDVCRGILTTLVTLAVLARQDVLPSPDELDAVVGTDVTLIVVVLAATFLLGMAEVLRDNAGQTIVPAIVPTDQLERANGRMWSAEMVANTFVGPPLGAVLLAVAFALPFAFDAATFFAAAALMATIPGTFAARVATDTDPATARPSWRADLAEGWRWLWAHELLRSMAIILGLLNLAGMVGQAVFVLFAQEALGVGPAVFSVIFFGGAIGGIIGGFFTSAVSARLGPGACLAITLGGGAAVAALIGLAPWWPLVVVLFAVETLLAMLWNVITVSLRQAIIPAELLGRVNSVYRFFAWGMIPVGAALGGLTVAVVGTFASREVALRATWFVSAAIQLALFVFGRRRLTTERIEAARAQAGIAVTST
jgi:MFS family permease